MDIGTGDGIAVDVHAAGAAEGAVCHALQLFQGGGCGDNLENGPRSEGGGEKTVQVHAVVAAVAVLNFRGVGGVEGGCGDHAEDLSGLIIVYADGAFGTVQGLIGCCLQAAVQGQVYPPAATVDAGDRVVVQKLLFKVLQGGGGDVPGGIAYGVEGGPAKGAVVAVGPGGGVEQNFTVAVNDLAQNGHAVVKGSGIAREGGPAAGQDRITDAVKDQPRQKQQEQYINKECALLDLFHLRSSFPKISSTGMSGQSAKKPSRDGALGLGAGAFFSGASFGARRAKLAF